MINVDGRNRVFFGLGTIGRDMFYTMVSMYIPLIAILTGYIVYMKKFKIDEDFYQKILGDLKSRGDIEHNSI